MKSNKRTMILLIALLLVGAVGYPILMSNKTEAPLKASEPILSADVNQMLEDITKATLNTTVLGQGLTYLEDFTMPLPGFALGRINPFAAIK